MMMNLRDSIQELLGRERMWDAEYFSIKEFIDKCSLSKFEELKDINYDEDSGGDLDDI